MSSAIKSPPYSLLSTLCQTRGVLSAVVVAQVLALIITLSEYDYSQFWLVLGQTSLLVQFITSVSIAILYVLNRLKPQLSETIQAVSFVLTLVVVTFLTTSYISYLSVLDDPISYWFVVKSCAISVLVTTLFVQFMAMVNEHANAHYAYTQAQLDALQARIKPHFLFNTLNTVAELAHQDPNAAEESALALASLSRAAINAGQDSTLEQEVILAKRYISLEQWRFGERLLVDWQLPETLPQAALPCLTLQPLLENAVQYSVQGENQQSQITVQMVATQKSVTIVVENTIGSAISDKQGNGIALGNIAQRLKLKFADAAQLTTRKYDGQFRVKLVVPRRV
ncbi:sensor histidine kinase [Pseudoalteromonas sp. SSDWG2]|uniref:sensor histidine kinase n=1 Tax=Pseudoalteromonas sp. SSDWG2 TaxID=3139391 RepID=UPI003BAC4EDB